ncbi:Cyanidin-3-O-glucoside 2-O-glucuronosyltransferase-like [Heracleum sosnowskyi]|uniref:Cyanidin-3-O-glucoside 2-O-glucuronosyltransferase-like n=1 Tax=Heracleum sosnowskyi TaxID=360622 RepID=A0AAD8H2U3_9APIA|nr:Cyanidin-3-O-glucoside 2-O-glucuronosyltransferase-like [Heracleum sosnowskyi]
MEWLDKKEKSSVVLLCFGSENYLSAEEVIKMANALETTKCNFIWALRSAGRGEEKDCLQLPKGFVDRVRDFGLILEWVPQTKILGHSSTGAFVSHCGWNSVLESIKFGVPIIAMPMRGADQPNNARVTVEVGVGMHLPKDSEGKFKIEEIGDLIRKALVDESGEGVRKKARELSLRMKEHGGEELDKAAEKLRHICSKKKETYQ